MGNQSKEVQKAPQKKEANDIKKEKTPEKVRSENEKAQKKLAETIQKPKPSLPEKKPAKKEKNWTVGLGTTTAQGESMSTSTTGITFENKKKTTKFSLGPTNTEEVERPGSLPKNKFQLFGVTFTRNF